eukprot:Sspe_Gene.65744::Locus_38878_Transcript_1_1_Confidence_1.000_Length_2344::g.65744::m.65744
MMRAAVLLLSLSGLVAADLWQGIRDGVDTWGKLKFNTDFAVNVGDRTGRKFVYQIGKTTMESLLEGASSSKWPTTTMISGLVKDGILSYDDKPSQYLSWWATDPSDARSHITLRHLLSFTDGYLQDGSADCAKDPSYDFVTCVHELYNATVHSGKMPGTTWAYLSSHYQFAGAMAVAASGGTHRQAVREVPVQRLRDEEHDMGQPSVQEPAAGRRDPQHRGRLREIPVRNPDQQLPPQEHHRRAGDRLDRAPRDPKRDVLRPLLHGQLL